MTDLAPAIAGLHHLSLPVADPERSSAWYGRTLSATRVARLDHLDQQGELASVVLEVPGLGTFLQLRRWPGGAPAQPGFQPITFGVPDEAALQAWTTHLDSVGVEHGGISQRLAGRSVTFSTPDGTELSVYLAA